jgi:cell division protein FtsA
MNNFSPILIIEINNSDYIFAVGEKNEDNHFKLIYKNLVPNESKNNYKITDYDVIYNIIKENIFLIEQKLNHTFTESILIINNFHFSFINLSGYKKLNGSKIVKDNITYILNSLKSAIDESEKKKKILHIFNSNYYLDKKNTKNLPVDLFGDFYSQELSFCLIENNDYKNINNIFNKCNLKIKKILLKSFVEGVFLINENKKLDTFFKLEISNNNTELFYFENRALKFSQNFEFGSDLVLNDVSKITLLNKDIVNKIFSNLQNSNEILDEELVEKELFVDENYRKIKKNLILDIALARIQELVEVFVLKNINLSSFQKKDKIIFLKISDKLHFNCFKEDYKLLFSKTSDFSARFIENIETESLYDNAFRLIHFGWNKEAVPVVNAKKSLIAKFFDALFN